MNEIVQAACERNLEFRAELITLQRLLSHPIFSTSITLGTSVISSLAVYLRSAQVTIQYNGKPVYESMLAPLRTQQLATGFVLKVYISSDRTLLPSEMRVFINNEDTAIAEITQQLVSTVQQLRLIIGHIEGLGKNRRIEIQVQVHSLDYGDHTIDVGESMRDYTEEEWGESSILYRRLT
jgi:hypothetical protein